MSGHGSGTPGADRAAKGGVEIHETDLLLYDPGRIMLDRCKAFLEGRGQVDDEGHQELVDRTPSRRDAMSDAPRTAPRGR